ncbi:MAG: Peptide/nickel transport system substrate-binding protein [Belnapia sp.]|nr:Peptide/nickel transport system substrate-binding protein [Belnapia sp.]
MQRRQLLAAAGGGIATLAAPRLGSAQAASVLRFKPQTDLTILDPVFTTSYASRFLGLASYDTLYGMDDQLNPHPQMVAGHVVENEGRLWRLTLRDGLRFHDGQPVRARDAVASIRRWGAVDVLGQLLMAATDEISAPSDREIVFRLKRPFPLLPNALGKSTSYVPVIMPERLVPADPRQQVTEVMGSGPYRFKPDERVSGVRVVWEKFEGYVPREGSVTQFTSGPKIAHINRIEWNYIPDHATAVAALINGELDWIEDVLLDLAPRLRSARQVTVGTFNPPGHMGVFRLNHLQPPFDNPAIRRVALMAVNQTEIVTSVAGEDAAQWNDRVGVFAPISPMASDAGLEVLTGPRDYAAARRALQAAGYRGETIVFISAIDNFGMNQQAMVAADQLRRAGFTVDVVPIAFGVWLQRRGSRNPPEQGGWSCTCTILPGLDFWDPISHLALRGNGLSAWPGWPTSPELETLRDRWVAASDLPSRQVIAREMQLQSWKDVPYIPTGNWRDLTAYRRNLTGMLNGGAMFYNLKKG